MRKIIYPVFAFMLVVLLTASFWRFYNPMILGDPHGIRGALVFRLDTDLTADTWLLGDTTQSGNVWMPEQPIEIEDIIIYHDPDADDSFYVRIYAYDATACEAAAVSERADSTAWILQDDISTNGTLSDTYKIIDDDEGMAVLFDHVGGTPNDVTIMIEYVTRIKDNLE